MYIIFLHEITAKIRWLKNFFLSFILRFYDIIEFFAELWQELWLKDSVLDLYPDTKGCSPALVRSTIVNETNLLL